MNDAFAAQNPDGFTKIIAYVALRLDPIDVALDAFGQIDTWLETGGANACRVTG